MVKSNFYITSPIYYVNDKPHIGHAYTSIACDTLSRFYRLCNNNVFFLTGSDEHGQKVEKSAIKLGKKPKEFCDEVSRKFINLTDILNLSNDDFIRTTDLRHKKNVNILWNKLCEGGFIYKDIYQGWYSIRDEAFYSEDEIIDNKAPSGADVEWHEEESYFFKLSFFQDKLLEFYKNNPDFIQPKSRYNEVMSFVKSGLKDLSISRTSFKWGIGVPKDDNHIIYVWLDALTNYLSAIDYFDIDSKKSSFWSSDNSYPIHIVGKDILRFHAIYWPAFLMAANVKLPSKIFAHGWWTNEGQKISKSVGNVIDPSDEIGWLIDLGCNNDLAVDYFRFFLLSDVVFGNDGDYSRQNFKLRINSQLANNIGNLVQRTLTMVAKNCDSKIPDCDINNSNINNYQIRINNFHDIITKLFSDLKFDKVIEQIIEFANIINKNINDQAPWNLKKLNKIEQMNEVLYISLDAIRVITIWLQPFMPKSTSKILDLLNIDYNNRGYNDISNKLLAGNLVNKPELIFLRLE
ncbi:MAG: methionine--tRNA ligase [Rickettsiales bacterium]|jgi:methionyl-tRNA synthetase|nr:methionine--tRNA ligase [Rickettsiales bacterium]|tara:strand:+ start:3473 stop:5026 length:1554 start_codon:yes stop_codon:yes gene_type:complete